MGCFKTSEKTRGEQAGMLCLACLFKASMSWVRTPIGLRGEVVETVGVVGPQRTRVHSGKLLDETAGSSASAEMLTRGCHGEESV